MEANYDSEMVLKTIQVMKTNEALWNSFDDRFTRLDKVLALSEAARRLRMSEKRCRYYVNYVKRKHRKEQKRRKELNISDEEAEKDKKSWKWYKQCSFLEARNPRSKSKITDTQQENIDVLVIDPDTEFVYISNESDKEDMYADDLPGSPPSASIASNPEEEVDEEGNKFLIDGICTSMKYQLSNSNFSEEQLMAFHSDIVKYMHSHFKKKKK